MWHVLSNIHVTRMQTLKITVTIPCYDAVVSFAFLSSPFLLQSSLLAVSQRTTSSALPYCVRKLLPMLHISIQFLVTTLLLLVKFYIWSIALYGAETWTLQAADQKYLESYEM